LYNLAHRVLAWLYFLPMALASTAAGHKYLADGVRDGSREQILWGLLWLAVALLCGLAMWRFLRTCFRVHEQGVSRREVFGTRRLLYQHLYTIAIVPYAVTTLMLGLVPISRHGVSEVRFVPRPGLEMESLGFWGPDEVVREVQRAIRKYGGATEIKAVSHS
jgi:hypothetical protein